jgi:peptidoglycan/LPS O-acetylase OafA/YrhL
VTRLLWWRPLAALGIATYSLYLWHVPVIALLKDQGLLPGTNFLGVTAIVLPVTIVVALLSFRYIERPILGMRERWSGSAPAQTQRRPDPAPAEQPAAP